MNSGVYCFHNTMTGQRYVGSTTSFPSRKKNHVNQLRCGTHHSAKLLNAWTKYGEAAFEFTILLFCAAKDLLLYEQRAIDAFRCVENGYNVAPIAGNNALGVQRSPETRAKISAAMMGHRRHVGMKQSEETKRKISASLRASYTAERRAAISDRTNGVPCPPERRARISAALKGRTISTELVDVRADATEGGMSLQEKIVAWVVAIALFAACVAVVVGLGQ